MSYGKLWRTSGLIDNTRQWRQLTSTWDSVEPGRTFALKNDGTLWTWKTSALTPVQIGSSTWLTISNASRFGGSKNIDYPSSTGFFPTNTTTSTAYYPSFLGIKSNGTLWYFFVNGSTWTEQQIGSDTNWADVSYGPPQSSAEGCFFAAIKTTGTLWRWGDAQYGQMGNNGGIPSATPVQVGVDTNWSSVKVSSFNGWALKTTGGVYAWGDGNTTGYYTTSGSTIFEPTQLAGALTGKTVTKLTAHQAGATAITNESTLNCYSWGIATPYGQGPSNTDRKPTLIDFNGFDSVARDKILDIASTGTRLIAASYSSTALISRVDVGSSPNGLLSGVGQNWITLNDNSTRPGTDWIVGNGFTIFYIENWSRPVLTSTLNPEIAPDIYTNGLGSVSYSSTNTTSVDINWGDGSTADTYAVVSGTNYTKTHNFFTYLDTDDTVNIALTASNPRYTSGSAVTTTYSNIKVYQVLPNPVISYAGDTTVTVPSGTTTTGSLTFNNAAMARHPGLTADFPSHYWYWQWGDGTTSTINVQTGLAGNENTNISRTLNLGLTAGVGAKTKVFSVRTTISTYGSKQSNTLTLTYFYEPVLQCTLAEVNNNLQITNTSLNADNYNIRIERTDSQGDINVSIANNSVAGGSGASAYVVTPTKDTTYTVTLSTTVNGVTYYSTPQTLTIYLPQSPTFSVQNSTLPYTVANTTGFQFNNTTADTLGHTANFAGNKWRWEWGDTTYTDVNVGQGLAGDRTIPINHTYTLTLGQINAGIPVTKTVTLKAYNGETGSPFASASQTITILPLNPNFPNRSNATLDDANIPDVVTVRTTQIWGVTGGGNT